MAKTATNRCPTGVQGLDNLIEGGLPRGRAILLTGLSGTGKTVLATQFLCNGATRHNEPGILVTLEQNTRHFKEDMKNFNLDIEKLEAEGKLIIIDASLSRFNVGELASLPKPRHDRSFSLTSMDLIESKEIVDIILEVAEKIGAKRIVIDSLPALDNLVKNKENVRNVILNMNYRLQEKDLTTMLISDLLDGDVISGHGVEEYVVDGVITMHFVTSGPNTGRHLIIRKMRGTQHSENINPIRFTKGVGIEVLSVDEAYGKTD